jgi:triosephosphate isomerase
MPQVGAQDCSVLNASSGAYTGDVSATMLQELGCKYVILGHSERRQYYNETSELVNKKAQYVHSAGMLAIICVGESQAERSNGQSFQVVKHQLLESMPEGCNHNNTIIAYEPCWAIGSGNAATVEDITEMHDFIGMVAQGYRIIYGGSVNPSNAGGILSIPTVGGVLIGGASLRCDHLQQILG